MIKQIIVLPRDRVLEMIAQHPNRELVCVISISSPFNQHLNFNSLLNDYMFTDEETREFGFQNQVHHMEFDDIDHNPHDYYMPMHFRAAVSTWIFAKHWHEEYMQEKEKTLFIHCDAGISRSAAIARSISEEYNIPIRSIRTPHPNRYVMATMKQGLRYLNEGLSPRQQREADQAAMEEVFDDAPRLSDVKEQAHMSTAEAAALLLGIRSDNEQPYGVFENE